MISVIIPCFNCEKFLERAVESVLKQTYDKWEIILVNNNSLDDTQRIIDRYVDEYPEKISKALEINKGACFARNLGLSLAKGEWIQFLDADDEIMPEKFERQLLLAKGGADVVMGAFYRVDVSNNKQVKYDVYPNQSVWISVLFSKAGITSSNLYARKPLSTIGGWNTELGSSQEYDMMFRLLKTNIKVAFDRECSALIYEVPDSISRPRGKADALRIELNYIDLRLRVASYLNSVNAWTPKLNSIFASKLFQLLMVRREASLEKIKRQMKDLNLRVPIHIRFYYTGRYFVKKIVRGYIIPYK